MTSNQTGTATDAEITRSVQRIYLNMYWVHVWVVDLCAAMTLRTADVSRKFELVGHLAKAREFAELFRAQVTASGADWDALDHENLRFSVIEDRYAKLRETATDLDYTIGVEMFAHGVIGCTEYGELYRNSPDLFPAEFAEIAAYKEQAAERAKQRLADSIGDDPQRHEAAADLARQYAQSLGETVADPAYGEFLRTLIAQGLLTNDVVARAGERFQAVFGWLLDAPATRPEAES